MTQIIAQPLTKSAFAPFGDVIETGGAPDKIINQGLCGRYHDLAHLDFADGHAGISVFDAQPRRLPHKLDLLERHPLGSQAFIPMHRHPYLVVVASDLDDRPDVPVAFLASSGQGVNYFRNTWHGVLCPLYAPGLFAVIDRIGTGANLDEHWLESPYQINVRK